MKNIHILPTDKASRLISSGKEFNLLDTLTIDKRCKYIYITSDEEIKEGNWYYDFNLNKIKKALEVESDRIYYTRYHCTIPTKAKKIILTTDEELIKDGVQAIDDKFLEWFIKNPSCEELVKEFAEYYKNIPLVEEPKQETLEEVAYERSVDYKPFEDNLKPQKYYQVGFIDGAKWQQDKNKYSEEDLREAFFSGCQSERQIKPRIDCWKEWFKQFKKK